MGNVDGMDLKSYSVFLVKTQSELLDIWESRGDTLRCGLAKLVREIAQSVEA